MKLHPETARAIELLKAAVRPRGFRMTVTSTYRSIAKQKELVRRWEAGDPRVITPAQPGRSTHNWGLSFDAVAVPATRQAELQAVARAIGLVTIPGDPVHFQIVESADWKLALQRAPGNPLAVLT